MAQTDFILYGANGYTGRMIAKAARMHGLRPILSGRDANKIKVLAEELGLDHYIISVDHASDFVEFLKDYPVILNAAGPFYATAKPIVDACVKAKTHYLDLSGEYYVFASLAKRDQEFKEHKIMILPGIGFDVVPTDCLARLLANQIKSPHQLTMAVYTDGSPSQGTVKSALKVLEQGLVFRVNNQLTKIPYHEKTIFFGNKPIKCSAATWSDVVTAYYSTGIDNISCYFALGEKSYGWLLRLVQILFKYHFAQVFSEWLSKGLSKKLNEKERAIKHCEIVMWIENKEGKSVSALLKTIEGYQFTVDSSLLIIQKVLRGEWQAGFQTPSLVFGPDLVFEIEGTELVPFPNGAKILLSLPQ